MHEKFISDDQLFTILSLNITSIPTNLQSFEDQTWSLSNINYDIIAFSDTRLDSNLAPLYNIPGYTIHSKHRNRHGGGVLMYVSDLCVSRVILDVSFCNQCFEWVCVELSRGNSKYFLASVYRPPNGNMNEFLRKLNEVF